MVVASNDDGTPRWVYNTHTHTWTFVDARWILCRMTCRVSYVRRCHRTGSVLRCAAFSLGGWCWCVWRVVCLFALYAADCIVAVLLTGPPSGMCRWRRVGKSHTCASAQVLGFSRENVNVHAAESSRTCGYDYDERDGLTTPTVRVKTKISCSSRNPKYYIECDPNLMAINSLSSTEIWLPLDLYLQL